MIFGKEHGQVVQNIKDAAKDGDFHRKVEIGDPVLTDREHVELLEHYLGNRYSLAFALKNLSVRVITRVVTRYLNAHTEVYGKENLAGIKGGAVITGNHFSPIDSTPLRYALKERLYIVSQDTNLAMTGMVGYIMKYSDIIPLYDTPKFVNDYFAPAIKDLLAQGKKIIIYPEEEMWLHYRKPRPPKRGAYYYAAANAVPVISCFTQIITLPKKETDEFFRTKFVVHILPTIYPDPNKGVRESSLEMMEIDYRQKKECYERVYKKPLTYDYERGDIAGWIADEGKKTDKA